MAHLSIGVRKGNMVIHVFIDAKISCEFLNAHMKIVICV